jgi:hypothetical protein
MDDKEYREKRQELLNSYQAVMQTPLDRKNIYLGMDIESIGKESPEKYLVVEWNNDFSLLTDKYPEYLFYSSFSLWEGVDIFLANFEDDRKVTVIKSQSNI